MKNGIKRALCLLAAMLMLVFAMTACGGSDKKDTGSTQSTTNNNTSSGSGSVITPSIEITDEWKDFDPYATISDEIKGDTVRFATFVDHKTTEGAPALANFKKDTGLDVELYLVPSIGYVNTLMTKIQSGDIPDVFVNNEGDANFPITIQIAAPINKVSTVNLQEPIWDQSIIATGTIEGNVYLVNTIGTPWSGSNMVFWNKVLFEENDFTTPDEYYKEGTWTWDKLLQCAKDIKGLGSDYKGVLLESDIFMDSLGTSFCKYDYKTAKFTSGINDKQMLEGFQWFAKAKSEGLIDGSLESFQANRCGLFVRGPYGLKNTGYFIDMDPNDVGYTPMPGMEEGEEGLISSIYRMYGIIEDAPNADAAGYFIRYWLDPKNYDLANTFLTPDAGTFYYELVTRPATEKYFNFDKACANIIGKTISAFNGSVTKASENQVKNALDSVSNVVDEAVNAANDMLQDKIKHDREKYK